MYSRPYVPLYLPYLHVILRPLLSHVSYTYGGTCLALSVVVLLNCDPVVIKSTLNNSYFLTFQHIILSLSLGTCHFFCFWGDEQLMATGSSDLMVWRMDGCLDGWMNGLLYDQQREPINLFINKEKRVYFFRRLN